MRGENLHTKKSKHFGIDWIWNFDHKIAFCLSIYILYGTEAYLYDYVHIVTAPSAQNVLTIVTTNNICVQIGATYLALPSFAVRLQHTDGPEL